jgi:hypothetical protein
MRRLLAPAIAVVLALCSTTARAEPYDLDLTKLGNPATDSQALTRFGILSKDMTLAMTAPLLVSGATNGMIGFEFSLEGAFTPVHPQEIGGVSPWPTRSSDPPYEATFAALHVRKGLPWSFELGGRILYMSQSSYYAGQIEARWATNEGLKYVPDIAVRAAWTRLFGQQYWNLSATDLDVTLSKSWGVNGVMSLAPYLAFRFTFMNSGTDEMIYVPDDPGTGADETVKARFPSLASMLYRTTLGVRMRTYAITMAAELNWALGGEEGGDPYPTFDTGSSYGVAVKFGFDF